MPPVSSAARNNLFSDFGQICQPPEHRATPEQPAEHSVTPSAQEPAPDPADSFNKFC